LYIVSSVVLLSSSVCRAFAPVPKHPFQVALGVPPFTLTRPAHGTPNLVAGAKTKAQDYDAFIAEFKSNFKEHNKGQVVRLKLDKLTQGKYSVDTYNKTFNDLATDASYNDEALIFSYL
jgi:hypothetical protein